MKRPCRDRRWQKISLVAIVGAQSVLAIASRGQAQQPPGDPSTYGLGTGMGQAPMGGTGGYGGGTPQYGPGYNFNQSAPVRPGAPTRPSSWPGSLPDPDQPPARPARRPAPLNPNAQPTNIYMQAPLTATPNGVAGATAGSSAPRYQDASVGYSQFAAPASAATAGANPLPANSAANANPGAPYPSTAAGGGIDPSGSPSPAGQGAPLVNFPPRKPKIPSPFSMQNAPLEATSGVLHFTGTEVIGVVGNDPILSGDVLPMIDESLAARAKAMGKELKDVPRDELDAARLVELKRQLNRAIETKMLFAEARRKIPKDNLPKVQEHANKIFDENECKRLMTAYQVKTRGELDVKLHEHGGSLDAARNAFFESGIGYQFLNQSVKDESEITHDQMLAYYREHIADYETPPRARWEQILVKFTEHDTKEEAFQLLAQWGNQIFHGASFAELAKAHSEDPSATDGGMHDWTTKGSLKYKPLDDAIFTLPLGNLSPIIEDDHGFSIVRVVERKEVVREPFSEAQVEIKKKIKKERSSGLMERYVEKLRARTQIWTIFDAGPNPAMATAPNAAAQR